MEYKTKLKILMWLGFLIIGISIQFYLVYLNRINFLKSIYNQPFIMFLEDEPNEQVLELCRKNENCMDIMKFSDLPIGCFK